MRTTPGRTLRLAPCLVVLLLVGCGNAENQRASRDASVELEASAPDGRYAASYVLESSNVPGTKVGTEATSTYAFTLDKCDDSRCWGTVEAPAKGRYTWDGTELVVTFEEIGKKHGCMRRDGQPMKGSTFWSSTEHWANLTSAGALATLEGSYQQETVFSDFRNGCDPPGVDQQWATFTLTLQRK